MGEVGKPLAPHVDDAIGAKDAHSLFVVAVNDGDDIESAEPRELNRVAADIARRAVDGDGLPLGGSRMIKEHLPCGDRANGKRRRLDMGKRGRLSCDHLRRGERIFGVAVDKERVCGTENFVARREAVCLGAARLHDPRNLGAEPSAETFGPNRSRPSAPARPMDRRRRRRREPEPSICAGRRNGNVLNRNSRGADRASGPRAAFIGLPDSRRNKSELSVVKTGARAHFSSRRAGGQERPVDGVHRARHPCFGLQRKKASCVLPKNFRRYGHELIDWLADYHERLADRPVMAKTKPGEIRDALPSTPPNEPEKFGAMIEDLNRIVVPGLSLWAASALLRLFSRQRPTCGNSR